MLRTVTVLNMQKSLGRLLEQVDAKGDQYVIERGGRPMAAVVPVWQLKKWSARRGRRDQEDPREFAPPPRVTCAVLHARSECPGLQASSGTKRT